MILYPLLEYREKFFSLYFRSHSFQDSHDRIKLKICCSFSAKFSNPTVSLLYLTFTFINKKIKNFRHRWINVDAIFFFRVEHFEFRCYMIMIERERGREMRKHEIYLYAWRNCSSGWLMHNVSTVCFTLVTLASIIIHRYIFSRCVFFYTDSVRALFSSAVCNEKDYWNLI